jgi:hypothetical protein
MVVMDRMECIVVDRDLSESGQKKRKCTRARAQEREARRLRLLVQVRGELKRGGRKDAR